MKKVLYSRRDAQVWCTVTAELSDGKLQVSGHDIGPLVEKFFGRDEYEYWVTLDQENTGKLFRSLGCEERSGEEQLEAVERSFGGDMADTRLKRYCEQNGIRTQFYCWP